MRFNLRVLLDKTVFNIPALALHFDFKLSEVQQQFGDWVLTLKL